jgi:hypothetical protein
MRPLISDKAADGWAEAYALKHREPRVIEVPLRKYVLSAVPAIILCIVLLVIAPNPVVLP